MPTAVKTRRKQIVEAFLSEERAIGFSSDLRGPRVDRESGVIHGVKVVGRQSPNTHGVHGVSGTEYTLEALEAARGMYEGVNVNVDHPPRKNPDQERSAKDRFAWLENISVAESGLYGDLHFLDPTDPLAVKMLNAAESKPDAYALSHNAVGRGEVRNGKYVVTEIPEVRSVDIVADGGTNRSLFEGRKVMATTTLRKLIENSVMSKKRKKALLEMGDKYSESGMDAERPAVEGDDEPGWKDHVTNAVGSLVKSDDPADHDRAGKLMKHLRPEEDDDGEETEDTEESEGGEVGDTPDDGEGGDLDQSQDGRKAGPEKKGFKNTADDSKGKESMESRQKRVRSLCKLAGVTPEKDLVESLAPLSVEACTTVLAQLRGNTRGPRSSSPNGTGLREGADVKSKAKQWAGRLIG